MRPSLCFATTNAIKAQRRSFVTKLKLIKSVIKYERIGFNFNDLQILGKCVLLSGIRSTIPSASSIVKFGQVQYFNFELLCPSFFSPVSQRAEIWKGSFHSPRQLLHFLGLLQRFWINLPSVGFPGLNCNHSQLKNKIRICFHNLHYKSTIGSLMHVPINCLLMQQKVYLLQKVLDIASSLRSPGHFPSIPQFSFERNSYGSSLARFASLKSA